MRRCATECSSAWAGDALSAAVDDRRRVQAQSRDLQLDRLHPAAPDARRLREGLADEHGVHASRAIC